MIFLFTSGGKRTEMGSAARLVDGERGVVEGRGKVGEGRADLTCQRDLYARESTERQAGA